jgi:hypothetical protein
MSVNARPDMTRASKKMEQLIKKIHKRFIDLRKLLKSDYP